MTCRQGKPSNQKPYGLLNPLDVPVRMWESIGIDFVGPLPISKNRDGDFDSITVIIDLLSAMVHLVPSHTEYSARDVAELVFEHVYKLHGLPRFIVSDRDTLFTSRFWEELHALIGTKLRMSSAYHPQSDGATERANRTITQMLRLCVSADQKNWVQKLPAIEFAINSMRSETTGFAPFFLNSGRMPRSLIWNSETPKEFAGVRNFAMRMKLAILQAHDSIIAARVKQTRNANGHRKRSPFALGDFVYVSTLNISLPKGLSRKLSPKFIGPYLIIEDFGNNSYRIKLPVDLRSRGVHDVFHSSLLRIHIPNDDRLFPGRSESQLMPVDESPGTEWTAEKIMSHAGIGAEAIFEIRWKSGDVSWTGYDQIAGLTILEQYLEALGVRDIANLPLGRGQPPSEDPQVFLAFLNLEVYVNIKECKEEEIARTALSFSIMNTDEVIGFAEYFAEDSMMGPGPISSSFVTQDDPDGNDLSPTPLVPPSPNSSFPLDAGQPNDAALSSTVADRITALGSNIHIASAPVPGFSRLFTYEPGVYYVLKEDNDQFGYFISAEEIRRALAFDNAIRRNISPQSGIPLAYDSIATAINSDPRITPYRLVTWEASTGTWDRSGVQVPHEMLSIKVPKPHLAVRCFDYCTRLGLADTLEVASVRRIRFILAALEYYQAFLTKAAEDKKKVLRRKGNYIG
ncbi:hypothetical protein Agabi119p4_8368 [Agaricus bisporus var. burnettii]|uniref:Integrase catalytic domain-containing protein n=1 Tax=Agaricus bisporus var. burnettii TaxID=192524 RepID=A0A8H7EYP0_AGABI|nr:hypothetical protein Agabi119p4_8368 [Agaricus bisporus var. burnettii]